jgi:hypothetical protein
MTEQELISQIRFLRNGRDALSDLAGHVGRAPLFDVPAHAGSDTWQGPAPDSFHQDVMLQCTKLREVIDELVTSGSYVADRLWALEQELGDLTLAAG